MLETFFVRVVFFPVLVFNYISHAAGGVPITQPRTLQPSTKVIFVPSNDSMALSRRFSFNCVDTWKASHCSRKPFRAHPGWQVLRGDS